MNKKSLSERDICTKYITPALEKAGWDKMEQIREEVTFTAGRVIVRGLLSFWAVHEFGMNMGELSRRLNISVSAVSISVKREEKIVNDNSISFLELLNR